MGLMKTADEKQAKAEEKAAAEYWESPVGQAQSVRERGDAFFQLQIAVARTAMGGKMHPQDQPDLLGQIERLGWKLENVGYVFAGKSSINTDHFSAVSGDVIGIYLFRAA